MYTSKHYGLICDTISTIVTPLEYLTGVVSQPESGGHYSPGILRTSPRVPGSVHLYTARRVWAAHCSTLNTAWY